MLRRIHAPDALKMHCRAMAMAVIPDHRDGVESLNDAGVATVPCTTKLRLFAKR